MKCEQVKGWFLSVTDEEEEEIKQALIELDYSPDSEGVKKFLLDCVREEEDETPAYEGATGRVLGDVLGYALHNPEKIQASVTSTIDAIKKGFRRKT